MCNCKNEGGQRTPHCNNFCDCVDWSDREMWLPHLRGNLIIVRDALTYDSLDTLDSKPAVSCVLGECKICGKQICIGGALKDAQTFDALMERLFRNVSCCDRNDEANIEDAVVDLLRDADRERARDWIYLNREKLTNDRLERIKPSLTESVRHVPGYSLGLSKSLYIDERQNKSDTTEITDLSRSDINWLKEQHELRARHEKEIVQKITEYGRIWNRYALETHVFANAIDVAEAQRPKHTGNLWVQYADGIVTVHEISNAVYRMRIRVEEPSAAAVEWNVRWELTVNALPKNFEFFGKEIIHEGKKKSFSLEWDANKYIAGRKKAYAKYFTEEFPLLPAELSKYFRVNGVLLPEYNIEQ